MENIKKNYYDFQALASEKLSEETGNPFAEVIESSLQTFTAQTWCWDDFPRFGSVMTLKSGGKTLFGIVYDVKTGTLDGHRQPFAYQMTEEQLKREQPQIFEFLVTTFSCLILGYAQTALSFDTLPAEALTPSPRLWRTGRTSGNRIIYQWAPEPPKIHAFVTPAAPNELVELFASDQYLHLIFNAQAILPNTDELLLALFKEQADNRLLSKQRLHELLETFSLLTGNDYRRLKLFLQRAVFLQTITQ